ncbi:uncharacterized protein LOC143279460 [Babylonia areolata]|uniref:uncharacterized protein LOC143279460 n=1 Tax=Babylonia areolata TaxID=304850 RepID=UPI003FD4F071
MNSLAEQLKKVKLRASAEPMRDFSSPKTAGFITDHEVEDYQDKVLDVNTEVWLSLLEEETFPSDYCPIQPAEAQLIVSVYERLYANLDPPAMAAVAWQSALTAEEREVMVGLEQRLQGVMDHFLLSHSGADSVFVKTSSRSAKDAPLAQSRFADLYRQLLQQEEEEARGQENVQITCLLTAAFQAMRVRRADEVLDMTLRSERIYQDLLLALKVKDRFRENFVIRTFVNINVDMEFRGFVFGGRLVALSQYNYQIHSGRLCDCKDRVADRILAFYNNTVRPKLQAGNFVQNFIIDFAIGSKDDRLWVIEINPFLNTTDAALFSWEHEQHVLQGEGQGFQFRVTLKPRPGAKTMLPHSVRTLLG